MAGHPANLTVVSTKKAVKSAQGILKYSEILKLGYQSLGVTKLTPIKGITPAVHKIKIAQGTNEGVIAFVVMVMDEQTGNERSDELVLTDFTSATTKAIKWAREMNGNKNLVNKFKSLR